MILEKIIELGKKLDQTSFMRDPDYCYVPVAGLFFPFVVQEVKRAMQDEETPFANPSFLVKGVGLIIYNSLGLTGAMYVAVELLPKL